MFNKVAKQAIAVERECGKLKSPRGQKLAAEPYQSAADALARFDAKGRARLRQVLDAGGPGLDRTNFVLRKMVAAVLSPNYPYPPADPAKLRHLGVSDAALAELANIGATPAQLFALAVQLAGERHPESFGDAESLAGWKRRAAALERERAEL